MSAHGSTARKPASSGVTLPQVTASALAAATAATLGSFLGVLGTIGGAAAAAIISTVGKYLFQRSFEATRDEVGKVRERLVVGSRMRPGSEDPAGSDEPTVPIPRTPAPAQHRRPWKTWAVLAGVAVSIFGIGLLASFGVESAAGRPLSGGSEGTSVGSLFGQPTGHPETTSAGPSSSETTGRTTPSSTAPSAGERGSHPTGDQQQPSTRTTGATPAPVPGGLLPGLSTEGNNG